MNLDNQLLHWLDKQDMNNDNLTNTVVNEVSAVASKSESVLLFYENYKNTVEYVEKIAQENNFEYCCIKALRVYSHFNTDLNIAVKPEDFKKIITILESLGWSRRSWWSQFKENVAERGKRKLVCTSDLAVSEIHLYPGLSWHGFEYASPKDVLDNKISTIFESANTYNTNHSLDMVSNLGHALFERYKFTAGEVFHVSSIIMTSSDVDMEIAKNIAISNGWGKGFERAVDLVTKLRNMENVSYPILIDKKILWGVWRERFFYQLRRGKPFSALLEILFNWVWAGPIYTVYSKLKKLMAGKSGIEKKYGDVK